VGQAGFLAGAAHLWLCGYGCVWPVAAWTGVLPRSSSSCFGEGMLLGMLLECWSCATKTAMGV
jgi:hypothetical protein